MMKKRNMKPSKRGLYIQDRELSETNFQPSTVFIYEVDLKSKVITIKPSEQGKNTVSRRALSNGQIKPVIDIRDSQVKQLLENAEKITVTIEKELIYVEIQDAVISIHSKDVPRMHVAEGGLTPLAITLDVLALFSGAGLLDEAFTQEGFTIKLALEYNEAATKTYILNHLNNVMCADIQKVNKFDLPSATVIIGGSPCKAFSNANRRDRMIDHPNNLLIREYIDVVKFNSGCKIFVLENVPEMLTAGNGKFIEEIRNELIDFEITTCVIDASKVGDPQKRERAFVLGSRIGKIELEPLAPNPILNTVGRALEGLNDAIPNQVDYTHPKQETAKKMAYVKQGGNWRDIPEEFWSERMGENTHSNIFRRLMPSLPSITLPNIRKSNILHPIHNRILSIRECARLFSLPDEFVFTGGLSSMQEQVCNGVPIKLGRYIAKAVKKTIEKYNSKQSIYC